jgi:hypothetical protein
LNVEEIVLAPEETVVSDAKMLLPEGRNVLIGEETYHVAQFKFGKTLMEMAYLAKLAKNSDAASLLEELGGPNPNIAVALLHWLPDFMVNGRPILMEAMGLALVSDKRLAEMDEAGEDPIVEIKKMTRVIAEHADSEKAMEIMALIIDGMGLDTIRKNFPALLRLLRS